jgi:cell division protein FtsW
VTIALVLAIALLGLVMVTSASVSIASKDTGQTFFYLERQLLLMLIGSACAVLLFCIRTELLEKASVGLLVAAITMLALVFIPGLGHMVNGSRRWLQLAGLNFQASELARVLVLIYLASYAVRREEQLAWPSPWACWSWSGRCWWPSRISARPPCCSQPASVCCSSPARDCAT